MTLAANYLLADAAGSYVDLQRTICVTNSARGGGRLLETLVLQAEENDWTVLPPRIVTTGELGSLLVPPRGIVADRTTVSLLWAASLRACSDDVRRLLAPGFSPGSVTADTALSPSVAAASAGAPVKPAAEQPADDLMRWFGIGANLARLDRELAGELRSFHDVAEASKLCGSDASMERCGAVAKVREQVSNLLATHGFDDPATRLRHAIESNSVRMPRDFDRIVLVGCADFNEATAQLLRQVSGQVIALIHCHAGYEQRFDDLGRVDPRAWTSGPVIDACVGTSQLLDNTEDCSHSSTPSGDTSARVTKDVNVATNRAANHDANNAAASGDVMLVDHLDQQALATARILGDWASEFAMQDVVIGVADREVVVGLRHVLTQIDVPIHDAAGEPTLQTAPIVLLRAVADYLEQQTFACFAAVARHPHLADVIEWGFKGFDWRGELDQYQSSYVAWRITDGFNEVPELERLQRRLQELERLQQPVQELERLQRRFQELERLQRRLQELNRLQRRVHEVLGELMGGARSIGGWAKPIAQLLVACYGKKQLGPGQEKGRVLIEVCTQVREVLESWQDVPEQALGNVQAWDALRLVAACLADSTVADSPNRNAIEVLGWLELAYDDTQAAIVTGFNDGFIPSSQNADVFLPDGVRAQLGMVDNERRYARDAFLLSAQRASRRKLVLIAARQSRSFDPRKPSRLWLTGSPERVARRILQFYRPVAGDEYALGALVQPGREEGDFSMVVPELQAPVNALSVTAFRDYLACPYRFYLRHICKLRTVTDEAQELDALGFGLLAHDVLHKFGESSVVHSADAGEIREFMFDELSRLVEERFGTQPFAAVLVQVEQLRARLRSFCDWQAEQVKNGYRIIGVEVGFKKDEVPLYVNEEPFYIYGRIDRIDRHEKSGVIRIWDYKTSTSARSPNEDHYKKKQKQWINLQLPLYKVLVESKGLEDSKYRASEYKLGYIQLPADGAVKGDEADWDDDMLKSAIECAKQVIVGIRNEVFKPSANLKTTFRDEFERLLTADQRVSADRVPIDSSLQPNEQRTTTK